MKMKLLYANFVYELVIFVVFTYLGFFIFSDFLEFVYKLSLNYMFFLNILECRGS